MRSAIVAIFGFSFIAACSQVADIGKSKVQRTKEAFGPCQAVTEDVSQQIRAAVNYAVSPTYATEERVKAETCADARRKLVMIDPGHPCIPLANGAESLHWALAGVFEGKREVGDDDLMPPITTDQIIGCQVAMGATPEEVEKMRADEAEYARQEAAAMAEAEAALKAADEASAEAMRALRGH